VTIWRDRAKLSQNYQPGFSTKKEGTGRGLEIVQGIVKAHGGRIKVVSGLNESGNGETTFSIKLPSV